jgi:hypothetical protein
MLEMRRVDSRWLQVSDLYHALRTFLRTGSEPLQSKRCRRPPRGPEHRLPNGSERPFYAHDRRCDLNYNPLAYVALDHFPGFPLNALVNRRQEVTDRLARSKRPTLAAGLAMSVRVISSRCPRVPAPRAFATPPIALRGHMDASRLLAKGGLTGSGRFALSCGGQPSFRGAQPSRLLHPITPFAGPYERSSWPIFVHPAFRGRLAKAMTRRSGVVEPP